MSNDDNNYNYRQALSRFATGIAIVSTRSGDSDYALTINSFTSVSLQPRLVLWSLQSDSKVYDIFSRAEFFTISILSGHQVAISDKYAYSENFALQNEDLENTANGMPSVNGALAVFECKQNQIVRAGDHELILAEVLDFGLEDSKNEGPLLFYGSQYATLSETDK